MVRFTDLLIRGLTDCAHEVEVIRPAPLLGRWIASESSVRKVAGALDRFLLFPLTLPFRKFDADILHIPDHGNAVYLGWVRSIPNVVTCHDVQPYRSARGEIAENALGPVSRMYQHWVFRWIKRAQYLPCVSETTREEFESLAGDTSAAATCVIDPALTYPYTPMSRSEAEPRVRRLLGHDESPFILHVGSNVWYKNRSGVAQIFDALVKHEEFSGTRLVTAGRRLTREVRDWLVSRGHSNKLQELGAVEDEDLRALYSTASFLLFPSLLEGFGMPIIEAQACGCLVVTSDRSPMREVGGSGAILVDPSSPDAAARTIAEQWSQREILKMRGMVNVKRYSVQAMISRYIELYNQAVIAKPL